VSMREGRLEKVSLQIKKFIFNLGTKILLPAAVITLIVGLSFLFYGPFSSLAYSDRMFLTGVGFMGLGTIVIFAQMITTRGMEIFFGNNRDPELIKKTLNLLPGSRIELEKRYNVGAQIWFVGLSCMVIGALITYVIP
jgi:hypothetical protein